MSDYPVANKTSTDASVDLISTNVGDLGNLTTNDKSSLVNATNEVKNLVDANIADIADLVKGKNVALNLPASWEQGTIADSTLVNLASNSRIRTGYIEISPSETYTISVGEGYMCMCPEYDADYAVTAREVGSLNAFNTLTFTSTATTKYVRIVVYKKGTVYNSTNPDDYIVPNDIVNVDIKLRGKGWILTNEELADLASSLLADLTAYTTIEGSGAGSDTYAIDFASKPVKNVKIVTADTDAKTVTVANIPTDCELFIELTYTNAAAIIWFSGITWLTGSAPVFTAGKVYRIAFWTSDGGISWDGVSVGGW